MEDVIRMCVFGYEKMKIKKRKKKHALIILSCELTRRALLWYLSAFLVSCVAV
jgi:hypothetical protein